MTQMIWLYLFFVLTQAADASLTALILNRGGRELNPIMRWAMGRIGMTPALVAMKIAICVLVYLALPFLPIWFMAALCLFYVGVCGWNALHLR